MKATLTFAILMVFALAAPRTATAQTSTVSGTLTNALSGDPIANTTVTLQSAGTMRQARTGPDGRFTFSEVAPGSYDLVVRSDGYLPSRTTVMVTAGAVTSDVSLSPELHFSEVVSVSPEAKDSFVSFQSTESLGGQELTQELQPTLGAE